MSIYCSGCGIRLQSEDSEQPGYVPPQLMERENITCQRCFRLTHYNQLFPVILNNDHYLSMLHQIGQLRALVIKIVDLFDFQGSWLAGLARHVSFNPILLVVNKTDLFPQVNWPRIRRWVRQQAREGGLTPVDVLFVSGKKGWGISALWEAIHRYREGGPAYIVGATNVGKSTIINRLLKEADSEGRLTTSLFPGTTLDLIEIPLEDGQALYDTPGLINEHQLIHHVAPSDLKRVVPTKPIKARVYQLNPEQTLFLGGLARLDFLAGERQSFVCYLSNDVPVHRTKLERADQLYADQVGRLLNPPGPETMAQWPGLKSTAFQIQEEHVDIYFSGLGWVAVKGSGARLKAYAPDGAGIFVRPTLL